MVKRFNLRSHTSLRRSVSGPVHTVIVEVMTWSPSRDYISRLMIWTLTLWMPEEVKRWARYIPVPAVVV